jgi:hypothetical protein
MHHYKMADYKFCILGCYITMSACDGCVQYNHITKYSRSVSLLSFLLDNESEPNLTAVLVTLTHCILCLKCIHRTLSAGLLTLRPFGNKTMCVKRYIEARSCNNYCSGKAICITYSECVCSLNYSACNAHAPYCHLWPARLYSIFPLYP